jgi:uncharacterized RDD family membrane protein YckC
MAADSNSYDVSDGLKPHVYDPITHPELFDGVRTRRIVAFLIELIIISLPIAGAALLILLFSIFTFGLGLILFWPLHAGAVIWALLYYGFTLGSSASATIGMRFMDLEMRTWYGAPCYFVLGAVHAIGFWISVSMLSPPILLVALFNSRKRLLHDILLGTIVINNPIHAARFARRVGTKPLENGLFY